jgi:uncharacterized protein
MQIKKRIFTPPKQSFFLFGPRGVGKSTFLAKHFPRAHWIDLLLPEPYQRYLAQPDRLRQFCGALELHSIIVIDEIQRVPSLLSVVHHIIEHRKDLQFILTGSSSRKLKRAGVDLLAGRALKMELHPFMACEIQDSFILSNNIKLGMIPLVLSAPDSTATLDSYLGMFMNQEVKAEGIVRNLQAFSRFLEVMSFSHAQQYNISEIARECGISRTAIASYMEILEDLLLSFTLPVFSARPKRKVVASRKFYYFDAGVFYAIRPKGPLEQPEQIYGAALEGLVAQHLKAWVSYSKENIKLYYWRTQVDNEVDFVLYGENTFVAIEVKHTSTVRSKDLKGLKAFSDDYPEATLLFLYQGSERLKIDSILCLPCEEFLKKLTPSTPLIE